MCGKTNGDHVAMKKQGFNPLANQDGIATIAMVIAVTTAVLSYTAFTATSYVMMMTDSNEYHAKINEYIEDLKV